MSRAVPLVRAAGVKSFIEAAAASGVPIEKRMDSAGFCGFPWEDLERPVPALPALAFLRAVAERDGLTDLGCRTAFAGGLLAVGRLGRLALTGRTPREVLMRIAGAAAAVLSPQRIVVEDGREGPRVGFAFPRAFDPAGVAVVFAFNAVVVAELVAAALPGSPGLRRIAIPLGSGRYGLADLRFETRPAPPNTLVLDVAPDAFDRPFARVAGAAAESAPTELELGAEPGIADVVRDTIDLLLDEATPSLTRIAPALGLSARTLQRALAQEGISFKALLDEVRQERALAAIRRSRSSLGLIAAEVGYTSQASLSRSVRRWTGDTPRDLRAAQARARRPAPARLGG